jgi:catechol 2,3-dioxygenase-like lactoylglutathione lyase family enzyme
LRLALFSSRLFDVVAFDVVAFDVVVAAWYFLKEYHREEGAMKLGYVIIYVADVPATLAFYQEAFAMQLKFLHDSKCYGELETGATTLAFAHIDAAPQDDVQRSECAKVAFDASRAAGAFAEVAFVTDDVAKAYAVALAAGAVACQPPAEKPWGQTVAYVRDLNGFLVELCTPIVK